MYVLSFLRFMRNETIIVWSLISLPYIKRLIINVTSLRARFRIRIRFLNFSGSGFKISMEPDPVFQISLDPDPVFKFLWIRIRFQPSDPGA